MLTVWRYEKRSIFLTVTAMLLLGFIYNSLVIALVYPLIGYLAFLYYRLLRLLKWVERGSKLSETFEDHGLIGHILRPIYYQKKQYIKRKKRTKRLLHRLNENISALPDATVLLNEHNEIIWFNEAAHYLLSLQFTDRGFRIDNLLRQPNFRHYLLHPKDQSDIEIQSPINPQDTLQLKIVCFGDNQRLLIARNISEQKHMQQVQKDFVANASHELQTPLTSIIGYIEMLEMEQSLSDVGQQSIQVIAQQTKRMQGLIKDLLQLSKIDAQALQPFDGEWINMDVLLNQVMANLCVKSTTKRLSSDIQTDAKLLAIPSDIQSLCSNLLENAIKHCPKDSQINVSWLQNSQKQLVFCVTDNGNGIEQEDLNKLTQRYFRGRHTTRDKVEGSGLGLAIVKQVAEKHGASLDFSSELGKGSQFCVIFPAYRNQLYSEKAPLELTATDNL